MRRHVPNILTGVSLVLCVATLALWAISYGPTVLFRYRGDGWQGYASTYRGDVWLDHMDHGYWERGAFLFADRTGATLRPLGRTFGPRPLGFGYNEFYMWPLGVQGPTVKHCQTTAPLWFVAALLAAPAGLRWWMARRATRRAVAGRCRECGYDLRATPDRCPECGRPVVPASATPAAPAAF